MTDTRTIGRYAHPSRLAAPPVTVAREDWRAKADEPLFMFFDGQSFKGITSHGSGRGALDSFSNYGITGAVLRPGKLQQNDWDWARAAVQCEYAFRAIEMVASDISAIPHGVKRRSTGAPWPDHPLMQALAWARRTLYQDVLSLWQKALYVFGENYLYPISNGWTLPGQTQPYYNGIQWLNPLVMEPVIQYSQLMGYDYTAYGMDRLQKHEVVLDKVSSMFDDIRGQSRISTALESINITIQVKRFTLDSFIKELRMQGVITGRQGSNLTTQDITKVVEQMKKEQESRLIGIPYPVEYTPIQHKWDDTQFKASEEALRAIAAALGIPLSVLGAWFSATYQSAPAQIEFYQNMVIFRECDRLKLFIDDVLLPYYDPAGEGEWYYDKDAALALSEDKKAKSELIRGEWKDGLRTMNAARAALKMDPVPGGDVFLIGDKLIPEQQLAVASGQVSASGEAGAAAKPEIFAYHIDAGVVTKNEVRERLELPPKNDPDGEQLSKLQAKLAVLKDAVAAGIDAATAAQMVGLQAAVPAVPINITPTTPQLPAPTPEKAVEPTEQPGMKSAFIGLTFPNHPDLIGLQNRVKQIVGEGQCTWNAPDDFHITLLYAPAVTDEQLSSLAEALDEIDVPDMALAVGSLGVFDNVGQHAVHFLIRRNGALLDLQAAVHELCSELGIAMSSYSDPAQYKPHVTMGYATDKLSRMKYEGKLRVKPASFCLKSGDEVLYERPLGDVPPDEPEPEPPAQKVAGKGALLMQEDVHYSEEYSSKPCRSCRWFSFQPNTLPCNIVINSPIMIVPDGHCDRWEIIPNGSTVNVWIEDSSIDNPNREPPAQKAEDMADSAATGSVTIQAFTPEGEAVLITIPTAAPPEPAIPEPQTEVIVEDEEAQTIEAAALDELAAWQKKAKNAGATKAADDFITYLIRDEIADGIRLALRDAGDDKAAIKMVFENARLLISLKSIQSTRIDFEDAFSDLLADAMAGKVSRRQWSGRMRSLIETYGYRAYVDGLRDGGVDDDPDSEDAATITSLIATQGEYISGLADKLYKDENAISDALAEQKGSMWYNGSVAPFYSAGLLAADQNGLYTWVIGNTEKHCSTCLKLNGQKKRYKTWSKNNLIAGTTGQATECKGFFCDCKLVRVAGKSSPGVLLDWQEYEHLHSEVVKPEETLSLPTVGSEEEGDDGNSTA